jgi:hypothetical protein
LCKNLLRAQGLPILDYTLLLLHDERLLAILRETGLMSGGHSAIAPPDLIPFVPTRRPVLLLLLRSHLL